jgi:hypothetical protein
MAGSVKRDACSFYMPGEDAPAQIQIRISLKNRAPQRVRPDASQAQLRYPYRTAIIAYS